MNPGSEESETDTGVYTIQKGLSPEGITYNSSGGDAFFPAIFLLLKSSGGGPGERITITSSRPDEVAYFLDETHSFSYHFWSALSGKAGTEVSLSAAFEEAASMMDFYQTAQLDANGNGIPNEDEDFTTLEDISGTIYALRRKYTGDWTKPFIGVVSDYQVLSGTSSATLMARSVYDLDGDEIVRVWAEIIRPDFNPHLSGVTVTDMPTVELTDPGPNPDGVYEGDYTDFDIAGPYIIKFYAKDAHGIVSEPMLSLVHKQ